jgi:hypothetical protein
MATPLEREEESSSGERRRNPTNGRGEARPWSVMSPQAENLAAAVGALIPFLTNNV